MSIRVLYFARSRELTRINQEEVLLADVRDHAGVRDTDPVRLCQLLPFLLARHADLRHLTMATLLLAHNQEMVTHDDPLIHLAAGDEVALIQPISGG